MGRKACSKGLKLAGSLAIALGVLLVFAAVDVGENGWTVLVVPRAESVGLLALAFIVGGWGLRRRLPGALSVVALAYIYLGSCQFVAASEVFSWVRVAEHTLFGFWLWSGALALGFHLREAT